MPSYTSVASGNWSSTAVWGGSGPPTAADTVTIASPNVVTIDTAGAAALACTINDGATLTAGTGTTQLTLQQGLTISAPNGLYSADVSSGGAHTLMVNASQSGTPYGLGQLGGGRVNLRGAPKTRWSTFTAALTGGSSVSGVVADATGWAVGDQLVIAASSQPFNNGNTSYSATYASISGATYSGGDLICTVAQTTAAGQHVVLQGFSSTPNINTDWVITSVPDSTHFHITMPSVSISSYGGAYAYFQAPIDKKLITSITPGSGTTATIGWSSAVYFSHPAGCPVGNFTSNLTITTPNNLVASYANVGTTTGSQANQITNVAFTNLGYNAPYYSSALSITQGWADHSQISNNSFYNCCGGMYIYSVNTAGANITQRSYNIFYSESATSSPSTSAPYGVTAAINSAPCGPDSNLLVLRATYGVLTQSTAGHSLVNPYISGVCSNGIFYLPFGAILGGTIGFSVTGGAVWSCDSVVGYEPTGASGQPLTFSGTSLGVLGPNNYIVEPNGECQLTFVSCPYTVGAGLISPSITAKSGNSFVLFQNENNNTAVQERYTNQSATVASSAREYLTPPGTYTGSSSALRMTCTVNQPITETITIPAETGVAVTVAGYFWASADYGSSTPPTVSLTGLGVSQTVTYSPISTGSTTLAATGYTVTRSSGSFITDGLSAGQRVYLDGFTNAGNRGVRTVAAVSALTLTFYEAMAATESAASGRSVTVCQPFTVIGTQTTGTDSQLALTLTAQSATAGARAWFSGVPTLPAAPWVSRARFYTYQINETSPTRITDTTVSATEAAAQAYAGVSVAWGSTSPVTISANRTIQSVWEYAKAWGCAGYNVANAMPFSAAGVAGAVSLFAAANVTINSGYTLNGGGSITMGSYTLSNALSGGYAYTYTGGQWSQATTVPTFTGGTLSLGAAATGLVFTANSAIITFAPTAAGTYGLGGGTFSGTLDLRNTSGTYAITVQLPAGTSYTAASNTGATITVSTPTVTQGIDFSGLVAGSQVIVYSTGTQTALYTVSSSGTSSNWNQTYSTDVTVDYTIQKVGYLPIRVTGVLCSTTVVNVPVQQVVDQVYSTPSGLTFGSTATVNTSTLQFGVTATTTTQNWYSFMIQSWINQSLLANVQCPLTTDGPNSFQLTGGWTWATGSIAHLTGQGMSYVQGGTRVAIWAAVITLGVPSGLQVRYQQSNGGTTVTPSVTGNINQLIQVYGDATHGNFDYRSWLVLKAQADGYDEAVFDVYATYGTLADQSYVAALTPTANGLATGNPSVSGVTITDHGASPVTWNGHQFSMTVTNAPGNPYDGAHLMRWVRYNEGLGGTFQGTDAFNWPDVIQTNGSAFKTVRGQVYGDAGATLKGVRVVQNDGVTPHPSFTLFTADDGSTYAPPSTVTYTISGLTVGSRLYLYDTANSVVLYNGCPGGETVTLGGTAHTGDVLNLTLTSTALTGSPITVSYAVLSSDTLATAAIGLCAAFNSNAVFAAANVFAQVTGNVVSVFQPSTLSPQATFSVSVTGSGATTTLTLGTGVSASPFVLTETYSVNRTIQAIVAYCTPQTANVYFNQVIGSVSNTNTSLTYIMAPVADAVYTANLVNGLTVTGFYFAGTTLHINVTTASVTAQQMYAYEVYYLSTQGGIATQTQQIFAETQSQYTVDAGFTVSNQVTPSGTVLNINNGWLISASGNQSSLYYSGSLGPIFINPPLVAVFNSASQAVNLATVITGVETVISTTNGNVNANIAAVNGTTVVGSGTSGSPWGPA